MPGANSLQDASARFGGNRGARIRVRHHFGQMQFIAWKGMGWA